MRLATLLVATVLCFSALAIDPPATRAGRTAIERYAAAKAKLDADYQTRLDAMQRQLAVDLRAAIKVATRNGDLADAQALQEYLDKLVGRTYTFQIDAAKDWQPTLMVKKGQTIRVEAEGEWCADVVNTQNRISDADGFDINGQPVMYLEGQIGDADALRIGTGHTFVASAGGWLKFRAADFNRADNSGTISVTITVK